MLKTTAIGGLIFLVPLAVASAFSFAKAAPLTEITEILAHIESGDPQAAERLLPLVYDELRKLAAAKMAQESAGHTLQATALVHEAYLRLVQVDDSRQWNSRGHFFGAAAEAMRRILVENARRKRSQKRGGAHHRVALDEVAIVVPESSQEVLLRDDVLLLDEALNRLAQREPQIAELVKLRFFGGLSVREAAQLLGVAPRTADDYWAYAKAWLFREINRAGG